MSVPVSQMWAVASHVLRQRFLRRSPHYPLVLMLEPLLRCNLTCSGCGKIQYPPHILKRHLSVDQCVHAAEECSAPVVSIAGGEPLLHPEIDGIVTALVARRRFVYLCTNALLLEKNLDRFTPDKHLTLSIHLDGLERQHDRSVSLAGTYAKATSAIREAVGRGFRVTTNTTLFDDANPLEVRAFFDEVMSLGVEGMTISPGYAYSAAPDQSVFHRQRARIHHLFRLILTNRHLARRKWVFNQSPLFLEHLIGDREFDCHPWGNPCYNIFGWQAPCYLLQEGYFDTFDEMVARTDWSRYGHRSGNPKCAQCMVHSGYEPSAVDYTFSGLAGMAATVKSMVFRGAWRDAALEAELQALAAEQRSPACTVRNGNGTGHDHGNGHHRHESDHGGPSARSCGRPGQIEVGATAGAAEGSEAGAMIPARQVVNVRISAPGGCLRRQADDEVASASSSQLRSRGQDRKAAATLTADES